MKKYSFFIILFFIILSFSSTANNYVVGVSVGVEISFGRHYPTCDQRGICHIKVDVDVDKLTNGSYITFDESIGSLTINTTQKSLVENQPDKLKDFQGKTSYNFMEDWIAPDELNKALKSTKPIIIKAGTYPLNFKNGYYTIVVKL
jgi:hypothetical protein